MKLSSDKPPTLLVELIIAAIFALVALLFALGLNSILPPGW